MFKHDQTAERPSVRPSLSISNPPPVDGVHCIVDMCECDIRFLNNLEYLERVVEEAARQCRSQLLQLTSQSFEPQGVTILGLLAESHISIHTWPELRYAAMDVFTCHRESHPEAACDYVVQALEAKSHESRVIRRGPRIPPPVSKG